MLPWYEGFVQCFHSDSKEFECIKWFGMLLSKKGCVTFSDITVHSSKPVFKEVHTDDSSNGCSHTNVVGHHYGSLGE